MSRLRMSAFPLTGVRRRGTGWLSGCLAAAVSLTSSLCVMAVEDALTSCDIEMNHLMLRLFQDEKKEEKNCR